MISFFFDAFNIFFHLMNFHLFMSFMNIADEICMCKNIPLEKKIQMCVSTQHHGNN